MKQYIAITLMGMEIVSISDRLKRQVLLADYFTFYYLIGQDR